MNYDQLFERAYTLCIKANSHAIAHDLHAMTESELQGVIYFLTSMIVN
jgi:hypothetical protein